MRKRSLIQHAPPATMSTVEQIRHLSGLLRKCDDPAKALVLSKEIRLLRELKKGFKKRHGGPSKKEKPVEPEAVNDLDAVLELEKQRRETPEPAIVYEHAKRAAVKAELRKADEAVENPPLQSPQSDVQEVADVMASPSVSSPGLIDMFKTVSRPLEDGEVFGSVGMTNAILRDFSDREPDPPEPVGELFSDGMGHTKRG